VTLVQAVAKGERMDDVVARAVEIGVSRVVPFIAERTVVRWDRARRDKARERWSALARAAAKQCRAPRLTVVADVAEGPTCALSEDGPVLVLHEEGSTRLRDSLPASAPDAMVVVVGPEGGLAPAEIDALRGGDASIVTLGERILRTETAGLVAVAIIAHTYGSLG
jgi:16S rRNA (uracil1498-N3)-methyltransferase